MFVGFIQAKVFLAYGAFNKVLEHQLFLKTLFGAESYIISSSSYVPDSCIFKPFRNIGQSNKLFSLLVDTLQLSL